MLSDLASLNFGEVPLTAEHQALCRWLNGRIPALCARMPTPLRDTALLALQIGLCQGSARNVARFYDKYYAPAWTVIPCLAAGTTHRHVNGDRVLDALGAQAAAMFLHLLDDHLADGDLPVDHLFLHLRTEAWNEFRACLARLSEDVPGSELIVEPLVERYFTHIHNPPEQEDLSSYEAVFRGQSATWLIAPLLTAALAGHGPERQVSLREMYEEFCLAWRALDDLRDCAADAAAGQPTAIFHLLPPRHRNGWHGVHTDPGADHERTALLNALRAGGYVAGARLIRTHLSNATALADELQLPSLAEQYRLLARPLEELQ
ncbi:hypothetical protein ABZ078_36925 [Streptomyces sp. NPDC006385]|uniref:hypothetical protein n=1 Tax=Streptomyces sp. NPDC006385 TaxID=3156761 RepID=UPI0033AFF92F